LLFNNQNADEISGKMQNYASHSFFEKNAKNMLVKPNYAENYASIMDLFPNEQIFYLDKSRQKFHHSLKEHHRISNIPKFRCEMLYNADNIALRSLAFFSHFHVRVLFSC
jgi:hypothetical protein